MQKTFMAHVTGFASLAMGAVLAISHGTASAADAQKGKTAYVKHGCWQCHGFVGQGGIGYDLKIAMQWGQGRYDKVVAIFLLLFLTIFVIDRVSDHFRNRMVKGH